MWGFFGICWSFALMGVVLVVLEAVVVVVLEVVLVVLSGASLKLLWGLFGASLAFLHNGVMVLFRLCRTKNLRLSSILLKKFAKPRSAKSVRRVSTIDCTNSPLILPLTLTERTFSYITM